MPKNINKKLIIKTLTQFSVGVFLYIFIKYKHNKSMKIEKEYFNFTPSDEKEVLVKNFLYKGEKNGKR